MKPELIKNILKLIGTAGDPQAYEKLQDQSEEYLIKYLKVVKGL